MKRLCLFLAVFFLFFGLISSCSPEGIENLIAEQNSKNEEDKENPGSDKDEEETGKDEKEEIEEEQEAPAAVFLSGKFVAETEIELEFSFPVKVLSLSFEPPLEPVSVEEGNIVKVFLEEQPEPGTRFKVSFEVEDEWENAFGAELILFAQNNRVPNLQINELRTESSTAQLRAEFIEFKILSDGNLGALRVFAAWSPTNQMIYQFLPVEVKAEEYVVLHLRTLEEHLCISEYGDCLAESGGKDSSPTARDIWIPGSTKWLRKTDAVYVMDLDDNVLDAVMISEAQGEVWSRPSLAKAAAFLFEKNAWASSTGEICRPADAVNSSGIGTAATRSISRNESAENVGNATNWFATGDGGATPGMPNKH